MSIPSGSSFNADSVNQSFRNIGENDLTVGEVKVGADQTAYLKVTLNNKEYSVTVGSDFVAGFDRSGAVNQQKFAQQLSQLLRTMHENPKITSALIDDHHFTYNGKGIDLNKVDTEVASIERKIETESATLPHHDANIATKTDAKNDAQRELEAFDAKRSFALFGKGEIKKGDMAAFKAAEQKLEKAKTELNTAYKDKKNTEKLIEELQEDLTQHQIARKFKDAVFHGGSSGMRAVVSNPTAAAATPPTTTVAAPTLTVASGPPAPSTPPATPPVMPPDGLTQPATPPAPDRPAPEPFPEPP